MNLFEQEGLSDVIEELFSIGSIQFGEFTLKSGIASPIYIDLRRIISSPMLMVKICDLLWKVRKGDCDFICGVPYTALPLATALSVKHDKPMVMRRKETKNYGTKRKIEGCYEKGQSCVIIEDIITSGSSILETVQDLVHDGLVVQDIVVFLDRQQGGISNLVERGYNSQAVCTITQVLSILKDRGHITEAVAQQVECFIEKNQVKPVESVTDWTLKSFGSRSAVARNSISIKLLNIMEEKRSNLCLSLDVDDMETLLSDAAVYGPHVAVIKTHVDSIDNYTPENAQKLQVLARKYNFLVFEDRKFGDIGEIVRKQYSKISSWSDLVTVHGIAGDGALKAIRSSNPNAGVLLVAQMSCKGNLINNEYVEGVMKMSEDESVCGIICQSRLSSSAGMIHFTPGVSISSSGDAYGQQYVSPEVAVEKGADIVIVGRGVTKAKDPSEALQEYKERAFSAYLKRISC